MKYTIKTCTNCLNDSSHPFKLSFDDNGLCYGCIVHLEKNNDLIFKNNLLALESTLSSAKKNNSLYQCIVPINGSAEDYHTINFLLEKSITPLVLLINNHFLNEIAWHNIHNLITHFDLDSISYTPEIDNYKSLVRSSLVNFNDINWPYRYLRQTYSIHVALEKKIPLIIWGMNQPIEFTGKFSHTDIVEMSEWSLKEHDLNGVSFNEALSTSSRYDINKTIHYPNHIQSSTIKGIYLSNYMPWDPWKQNSIFEKHGFMSEDIYHTFDQYENVGSSIYYNFHDLLRLEYKGYKKVKEHLSREIRHGRISRKNAMKLLNEYNQQTYSVESFFDWLGVTKSGKEWWILHKIPKYSHLIGEKSKKIIWKKYFKNYFSQNAFKSKNDFVSYMKGI
tara:strand:- start:1244 stop:2416 length:1173 start_codon:yes stop_codon:yes gene_type:complete